MKLTGGFAVVKQAFSMPNYRLYVIGNLTSTTGLWMQRVAIGWLTWELTQSAAWLGAIVMAESVPALVLGLFGGALVDRMDCLKLLRITQVLSVAYSVMLAISTFAGIMDIWLLFSLTLFRGGVLAFSRPSRMTVVYAVVGRDLLASALALNSMIFNLSRFVGPGLGGAVIATVGSPYGVAVAFTLSAIMLCVMTVALSIMRLPPSGPPAGSKHQSMLSDTFAGVRYILGQRTIRVQIFLLICTSTLAKPVMDLYPGFAADVFGRGADGLGLLLSCHGLGATLGGAWLTSRSGGVKGLTKIMISAILVMAIALLIFTSSHWFWLGCAMAMLCGSMFIIMSVSNQTLIQASVDPSLRGRVIGVYGMVAQDLPAVGAMMMGGFAEHFGLQLPVAIGAGICLIVWSWAIRQRRWMAASAETELPADAARGRGGSSGGATAG